MRPMVFISLSSSCTISRGDMVLGTFLSLDLVEDELMESGGRNTIT
jgi:hypothetical protein